MRKHRHFEKVDNTQITVVCPCLTPRELMNMVAADIEPNIKARKALYGQGSEFYPIPRTMSIDRFSRMASRPTPTSAPIVEPPIESTVTPQE